jgi:hypothetical protein
LDPKTRGKKRAKPGKKTEAGREKRKQKQGRKTQKDRGKSEQKQGQNQSNEPEKASVQPSPGSRILSIVVFIQSRGVRKQGPKVFFPS